MARFRALAASILLVTLILPVDAVSLPSQPNDSRHRVFLAQAAKTHTDALVVMHHGQSVLTWGPKRHQPILIGSLTKLVTALAVGAAIHQGCMRTIDQPVSTWLASWRAGLRQTVTLRHLLTHTAGLGVARSFAETTDHPERVPLVHRPGTRWRYSNAGFQALGQAIEVATGTSLDEFVATAVFTPLGITRWSWFRDDRGVLNRFGGVSLRASDVAKLGQLVLQDGRWAGKAVLGPAFARAMLQAGTPVTNDQGLAWMLYQPDVQNFQRLPCHTGSGGQWLVLDPPTATVVVRLRDDPEERETGPTHAWDDLLDWVANLVSGLP